MNPVAIAALETSSIAQGVVVADAMLKTAEVTLLEASSLSPGRFWVLVGGEVATVRASHRRGVEIAADTLLDQLFIPQLHEGVLPALRGLVAPGVEDALGMLETLTAASAIVAADTAVKAANVVLRDIRLANGIGGKGVVSLTGTVSAVQAAIEAGRADALARGLLARAIVIPRVDAQLRARLPQVHFARVIGTVVCTEKVRPWRGARLLMLQPCDSAGQAGSGRPLAAVDLVSAAPGQLVFYVRGREAAVALQDPENPADAAIVGIVDAVREDPGAVR